jgi:hypothetical protein
MAQIYGIGAAGATSTINRWLSSRPDREVD